MEGNRLRVFALRHLLVVAVLAPSAAVFRQAPTAIALRCFLGRALRATRATPKYTEVYWAKATTYNSAERTWQGQDRGSLSFGAEVRFDMEPATTVGG
jgi:hypothetical protein